MRPVSLLSFVLVLAPGPLLAADAPAAVEKKAPLFENIGGLRHEISTDSDLAQRYFDQGLTFAYGFNHAEAVRSFLEAVRHDPDCAICYWGASLALGPNINAPMGESDVPRAWEYLQKAIALSEHASPKERDYIKALATRYVKEPVEDRSELNLAYANAMRDLARKYPDDLDARTLFAEALMDTMPWDYWTKEGEPKPATKEVIGALEHVIERDPDHIGALHYYIHAVEASSNPGRAEPAADRLGPLVPIAGHLVHMPSHIYLRVGRYNDASKANVLASQADERYIEQCKAQGLYPAMYYPHNVHFLWYTSTVEGRSEVAVESAEKLVTKVPVEETLQFPLLQMFFPVPLFTYARFGQWEKILSAPEPDRRFAYVVAMWHYARGLAWAAKGQPAKAAKESAVLSRMAASDEIAKLDAPDFPSKILTRIADTILKGEVARAQGKQIEAIHRFEEAAAIQDDIPYMEPPYWYFPVRQFLGAALLEAKRPEKAELVFRKDLEQHPRNGWSLYGLVKSLEAQGERGEAAAASKQFETAWSRADVRLTTSRF